MVLCGCDLRVFFFCEMQLITEKNGVVDLESFIASSRAYIAIYELTIN